MWEIITCQICGKECKGQLGNHLRTHGLSIKEYEKKYGSSRDPNLLKECQKSGSLGGGYRKGHFKRKEERINVYLENPDLCKECDKILTYQQHLDGNLFCSSSCSATYNNIRRGSAAPKTIEKIKLGIQKYLEKQDWYPHTKIFFNVCEVCNKEFYWKRKIKSCSKECRDKLLSDINLQRSYKGFSHSRKIRYNDCWLGSPYELELAKLLDKLGVKWSRPKYLFYKLTDGKRRKYYPDFLLENGVYIDTKNSYLQVKDRDKLLALSQQNNVIIVVFGLEGITEENMKKLLNKNFSLINPENLYF